jgi:hypothetical protein
VRALLGEWRRQQAEPGVARLEALWTDMGGDDAVRADRAAWALAAAPQQAVALLRGRLRPAAAVDSRHIARLVADLDHARYAVRQRAEQALAKLGDRAEPALRQALEGQPSLEMRRRVVLLLEKVTGPVSGPEPLRSLRAVEVLERIDTPEARRVLTALADGAPGALLTREARASLDRLARRQRRARSP